MDQAGRSHSNAPPPVAAPAPAPARAPSPVGAPAPWGGFGAAPFYLRPQTFGSILRNMIRLYRENLRVLFILYGVPQLVLNLVAYDMQTRGVSNAVRVPILMTVFFIGMICVGPVSVALSEACLGLRPTVRRSIRRAAANGLWRLPVASLLSILATFAAMILLIVPGFIVMTRLMLIMPVVVLEGLAPRAALKRCWRLTQGYAVRNFAYFIAIILLFYGAFLLLSGIGIGLVMALSRRLEIDGLNLILSIIVSFVSPIFAVFPILLYYDMRVRKEDYNVEALEQDLST